MTCAWTYASDRLEAGADLPAVQQLRVHAFPSTTSRYDRGHRARRSAAERLSLELREPPRERSNHDTPPKGDGDGP